MLIVTFKKLDYFLIFGTDRREQCDGWWCCYARQRWLCVRNKCHKHCQLLSAAACLFCSFSLFCSSFPFVLWGSPLARRVNLHGAEFIFSLLFSWFYPLRSFPLSDILFLLPARVWGTIRCTPVASFFPWRVLYLCCC